MKKKLGVLVLACAMTASAIGFSVSAENVPFQRNFEIRTGIVLPTMDVTFPTSVEVVLNPYHLSTEKNGWVTSQTGVTSPEYEVINNSPDAGIVVSAKLSATGNNGVGIAASPIFRNDGTENKMVFAFLNTTLNKGIYANTSYTVGDNSQLPFTQNIPERFTDILQIEAMSRGYFCVQGEVVERPAESWSLDDSVTLNMVFDVNMSNYTSEFSTEAEVTLPNDYNVYDPIYNNVPNEPVVTEPVATEPVVTEPVVTEPVETTPVETTPVVTEPVIDTPDDPSGNIYDDPSGDIYDDPSEDIYDDPSEDIYDDPYDDTLIIG